MQIGSAAPNVVTWVESHDNYINDGTSEIDDETVKLAYAFIVSRAEAHLFSSLDHMEQQLQISGERLIRLVWHPIYKDPIIVAANRFRNVTVGLLEVISNPGDNNRVLCVERGTKGLVMINVSEEDYTFELETVLENGEYTDRIDGETWRFDKSNIRSGKCGGSWYKSLLRKTR